VCACLLEEHFDGRLLVVFNDAAATSIDASDELCFLV